MCTKKPNEKQIRYTETNDCREGRVGGACCVFDNIRIMFYTFNLYTYFQILIIPFAWTHPAVDMSRIKDKWKGSLEPRFIGVYIDLWLLTIGGCFTWQVRITSF